MNFLIRLFLNALALLLVSKFLRGIRIDDFVTALLAALVIGILNALVRPVLLLLTLPLNILSLGLFTFVINAIILWLTAIAVPGFGIDRFFPTAILAAILLAIINMLIYLVTWR